MRRGARWRERRIAMEEPRDVQAREQAGGRRLDVALDADDLAREE